MALTILGTVVIALPTPRTFAPAPLSRRVPQPPFTACSHLGIITTAACMLCLCSRREHTTRHFTFGPHGTETQNWVKQGGITIVYRQRESLSGTRHFKGHHAPTTRLIDGFYPCLGKRHHSPTKTTSSRRKQQEGRQRHNPGPCDLAGNTLLPPSLGAVVGVAAACGMATAGAAQASSPVRQRKNWEVRGAECSSSYRLCHETDLGHEATTEGIVLDGWSYQNRQAPSNPGGDGRKLIIINGAGPD